MKKHLRGAYARTQNWTGQNLGFKVPRPYAELTDAYATAVGSMFWPPWGSLRGAYGRLRHCGGKHALATPGAAYAELKDTYASILYTTARSLDERNNMQPYLIRS